MTSQTELASAGIIIIRQELDAGTFASAFAEVAALCDYAQAQIEARSKGGRTMTDARRAANRLNASKPRKRKQKIIQ